MRKNTDSRCLIHLDAGIISLQFTAKRGALCKGCCHTVEHIGTRMVADYLFSLCFNGRTEKIVCGSLPVGSAGNENLLFYLAGKFF